MATEAGSVAVSDTGVASGTGLARTLYDYEQQTVIDPSPLGDEPPNEFIAPTWKAAALSAMKGAASTANKLAVPLFDFFVPRFTLVEFTFGSSQDYYMQPWHEYVFTLDGTPSSVLGLYRTGGSGSGEVAFALLLESDFGTATLDGDGDYLVIPGNTTYYPPFNVQHHLRFAPGTINVRRGGDHAVVLPNATTSRSVQPGSVVEGNAGVTLTIPGAEYCYGQHIWVRALSGTLTITPQTGLIEGAASATCGTQMARYTATRSGWRREF